MSNLSEAVHAFVRGSLKHEFGRPEIKASPDAEWAKMTALGTQLWLDTGDIEDATKLWNTSFTALTTNNTLLNKEIQKGIYDGLVASAAAAVRKAAPNVDDRTMKLELAFILNAWHGLRLVEKFDAKVSVELHTDLSHDVDMTVDYGRRFFAICPERFIVKVPLTPAGYLGARELRRAGVPINFTLGFSARQNVIAALLTKPDYVNVFLGRINALIADNKLGTGEGAGEKATLATQRALLEFRSEKRSSTKLIGASIRNGAQIEALSGLDVFTMPPKSAAEYRAKPPAQVVSRVQNDPVVRFADGVDAQATGANSFWDITPDFIKAVESLLAKNCDVLKPDGIVKHFAAAGFSDLFPRWTPADHALATKDGKIPVIANWKARIDRGEIGLDALLNLAAYCSFTQDQLALDNRVKSLLG
jgi:transaldolase